MDSDFKGEVPRYRDYLSRLCAQNKGPGTEFIMLAEWIKHNEVVSIKIQTDPLLQSLEGAGLTLSSGEPGLYRVSLNWAGQVSAGTVES